MAMGEGDMQDRLTAYNAYCTARSSHPELPAWGGLSEGMQAALQHVAGEATLSERAACASLAETLKTLKASLPTGAKGEHETEHTTVHGEEIAAAIRARA